MMKKQINKAQLTLLATVLPLLYGCQGGGGSSSFLGLGSLFSGFGAGSGSSPFIGGGGGTIEVATLVNPEPASMLLLGGGMMALGVYKRLKK